MIKVGDGRPREDFKREELKIYRKYVSKLNWLARNTKPDISVYMMKSARSQKEGIIKDLRDIKMNSEEGSRERKRVVFEKK